MSSRRLNATDKKKIVAAYRKPGETAITLAERFGVSNSTIGRILKDGMSTEEYDSLVQQKRGRNSDAVAVKVKKKAAVIEEEYEEEEFEEEDEDEEEEYDEEEEEEEEEEDEEEYDEDEEEEYDEDEEEEEEEEDEDEEYDEDEDEEFEPAAEAEYDDEEDELDAPLTNVASEEIAELAAELGKVRPRLDDEEDLEDDLEEGLDEDFDEEFEEESAGLTALQLETQGQLTIRPLATSTLPRVCYLVVDRAAELIAPSLREFGELGTMSAEVAATRTLPVFDNHRVAKRFSNIRTQRVIKVPDSSLFQKTAKHLQAKGIKHLLVDGQVFSL
jgi:hypothetical protein